MQPALVKVTNSLATTKQVIPIIDSLLASAKTRPVIARTVTRHVRVAAQLAHEVPEPTAIGSLAAL